MPAPPHHLLRLDVSPGAFRVLVAAYARADAGELAAYQRGEGPAPAVWPSVAQVQEDTGLARSTVIAARAELVVKGVMGKAIRDGRVVWELTSRDSDQVQNPGPSPESQTESKTSDPVQIPGPPRPSPSHTLPLPTPPEQASERETRAEARGDLPHATCPDAPQNEPRAEPVDVSLPALVRGAEIAHSTPSARGTQGPAAPEAPPGLVADVLVLCPPEPGGRKASRKAPPRDPPAEHPGVAAALDALHAGRVAIDRSNRKARSPTLSGDVAKLERPLRELGLVVEGGALDWSWWPRIVARFVAEVKAEAEATGARLRDVRGGRYLDLDTLSRPANFRRYLERDYLDEDSPAPPAQQSPRPRAPPGRGSGYRPGAFQRGESDME